MEISEAPTNTAQVDPETKALIEASEEELNTIDTSSAVWEHAYGSRDSESLEDELLQSIYQYIEHENVKSKHYVKITRGRDRIGLSAGLAANVYELTAELAKIDPDAMLAVWQLGMEGDDPTDAEHFEKTPVIVKKDNFPQTLSQYKVSRNREKIQWLLSQAFGKGPLPFSLSDLTRNWYEQTRSSFAYTLKEGKHESHYLTAEACVLAIDSALEKETPKADDLTTEVLGSLNDLFGLNSKDLNGQQRLYLNQTQFEACHKVEKYCLGWQKYFPREERAYLQQYIHAYSSSLPLGDDITSSLARDVWVGFVQNEFTDYLTHTALASPESFAGALESSYLDRIDDKTAEPVFANGVMNNPFNPLMEMLSDENQNIVLERVKNISAELIESKDLTANEKVVSMLALRSLAMSSSQSIDSAQLEKNLSVLAFHLHEESQFNSYLKNSKRFFGLLGDNPMNSLIGTALENPTELACLSAQRYIAVLSAEATKGGHKNLTLVSSLEEASF